MNEVYKSSRLSVPKNKKEEMMLIAFRARYPVTELIWFMNTYLGFRFQLKIDNPNEINTYISADEKVSQYVEGHKKQSDVRLFYRALDPTENVLHFLLPYNIDYGFLKPLQISNIIYNPNYDPLFLFKEYPLFFWFIYSRRGGIIYKKEYLDYVSTYLQKDFFKEINFINLGKEQQGIFFRCMC